MTIHLTKLIRYFKVVIARHLWVTKKKINLRGNKMGDVVPINGHKDEFFTLEEVQKLVPVLIRISTRGEKVIQKAMDDQRFYMRTGAPQDRVTECDNIVGTEMAKWGVAMYKLGGRILPGGWVGFDFGSGLYLWHLGESGINWYCGYETNPELFRRPLIPVVKQTS